MRFGIGVTGAAGTLIPRFEFTRGSDCASGDWTTVTPTSSIFNLRLSDHFIDNDATTEQITSGSFVAGNILESTNPASSLNLPKNKNTEYEWSMEIAKDAPYSTTYRFRVSNDGTAFNTYGTCPALTTQASPSGPSADLSITKSDSPDPIVAGGTLSYTITVMNSGPDTAENVVVSDTLPLALTSPTLTPSQGACAVFPCNLGSIANGQSASITVASPTDPSVIGTITNIASVASDTDDPSALNNASTQETTASSPPVLPSPPPSGGGGTKIRPEPKPEPEPPPTTVAFSGRAFPDAKIFIVDKDIRFETKVNQNSIADENGTFLVNFTGISEGLHSFGLLVKDKNNRAAQTKFFTIAALANDSVVKDILVPPTIELPQRLIGRGQPVVVVGNATPNNVVILEIDDVLRKETTAGRDGSYTLAADTTPLEFGAHRVRVKQVDVRRKQESAYSLINALVVSRLTLPKADLSGDGAVTITDWSMFLSHWTSADERQKQTIDFNGDGKINISDFSIFIRAIRK